MLNLTLQELEQVKYKKREIEMINDQIIKLYNSVEMTSDTVQGSSKSSPYVKHTITVTGIDVMAATRVNRRAEKLKARRRLLEADVDRAEDFIDKLTDSQLRQIIELKFITGMSWNMVAQRVYEYPDGDRARKKVGRYFKNF